MINIILLVWLIYAKWNFAFDFNNMIEHFHGCEVKAF